jgi:agmatinase
LIPAFPAFAFIAVPYEKTTSFMQGAALGPEAFLQDWERLRSAGDVPLPGMTYRVGRKSLRSARSMFKETGKAVMAAVEGGLLPVTIGGEHTVTVGAVRGLAGGAGSFGVVQLDAHADLRERYEGSRHSHACVMRRIAGDMGLPVLPVGVRALSRGEALYMEKHSLRGLPGNLLGEWRKRLPPLLGDFPEKVYLTVDMDFFDPSVAPGVGTPEPGGAGW